MTERAAHLMDAVLPWVPVRRWVLTVLYRLRCRMAFDHGLSRAVLGVYARVLCDAYARGARALGGVLAFGIIGLFMGPVLLAVSYTLLVAWVDEDQAPAPES